MPRRKELPRDFEPNVGLDGTDRVLSETNRDMPSGGRWVFLGHSEYRALNEFEALMQCAPHEEPDASREERLELRDVIVDAIDGLNDEERWVFDALFVRGASLRELAREIAVPKTTLARRRDALLVTLREKLQCDQSVMTYLEGK